MLFEKAEARKLRGSGVTFPVCVFFFFFDITLLFLLSGSREVKLPNVTQLDLLDAVQRLREMKVKVRYGMV